MLLWKITNICVKGFATLLTMRNFATRRPNMSYQNAPDTDTHLWFILMWDFLFVFIIFMFIYFLSADNVAAKPFRGQWYKNVK